MTLCLIISFSVIISVFMVALKCFMCDEISEENYDNEDESGVDTACSNGQGQAAIPGFLLPAVAPAASTLSKQEQDRLAMPPPPPPSVSALLPGEATGDADNTGEEVLAPLAGTIGSGKKN